MEDKVTMNTIPEMKIVDNKIVEETISIDLVVNGKTEQVVMRKLNSGVRGKIRSSCTKTKFLGGQQQITINDAELETQLIQAAIVSAPFPHELEDIKSLPGDVVDYLMTNWSQFSTPTAEKKE
jgi:hypothetical protein